MKKFVVSMMLMMCVASASAQWSVTPEVGMNVTTYENTAAKIGFKGGAAVAYTFGEGLFSLQSGLYYVQRGTGESRSSHLYGTAIGEDGKPYDTSISFYSNGYAGIYLNNTGYGSTGIFPHDMTIEGIRSRKSQTRKDYLQLPIMARFNWKIGNDVRLHVAAGPYVALGIGGREKWSVADITGTYNYTMEEHSDNPFGQNYSSRRFDWGATLNAGIEVKRFTFNISYDMGLGKQYKHDDIGMKYHTASFTVGYRF